MCRKRRFTYQQARMVVVNSQIKRVLRGSEKRRECREYVCRECQCWHVTSREGRGTA